MEQSINPSFFAKMRRDWRNMLRDLEWVQQENHTGKRENIDDLVVRAFTDLQNPSDKNLEIYIHGFLKRQGKDSHFFDYGNITAKDVMARINTLTDEQRANPALIHEERKAAIAAQEQARLDQYRQTDTYKAHIDHSAQKLLAQGIDTEHPDQLRDTLKTMQQKGQLNGSLHIDDLADYIESLSPERFNQYFNQDLHTLRQAEQEQKTYETWLTGQWDKLDKAVGGDLFNNPDKLALMRQVDDDLNKNRDHAPINDAAYWYEFHAKVVEAVNHAHEGATYH